MGYTSQLVTGYYGDITFNNVAYFQIVNGLTVTGWVDNDTYNKLFAVKETIVPEVVESEEFEWEEIEETKENSYLISSFRQIIGGNFVEDVTILGTGVQIGLAFFGVDFWADCRDITADIAALTNGTFDGWQFAFDVIALVPVIGAFKCTDEAALIYKSGDKIYMATKHVDEVAEVINEISKIPDKGFETFSKLKNYLGNADYGYAWHHIVEQSQISKAGFTAEQIHNVRNVVQIPSGYSGSVHAQLTGIYTRTTYDFTNGLSVRDWLATKSFEEQFEFGLNQLRKYGTVVATENGWIFIPFS